MNVSGNTIVATSTWNDCYVMINNASVVHVPNKPGFTHTHAEPVVSITVYARQIAHTPFYTMEDALVLAVDYPSMIVCPIPAIGRVQAAIPSPEGFRCTRCKKVHATIDEWAKHYGPIGVVTTLKWYRYKVVDKDQVTRYEVSDPDRLIRPRAEIEIPNLTDKSLMDKQVHDFMYTDRAIQDKISSMSANHGRPEAHRSGHVPSFHGNPPSHGRSVPNHNAHRAYFHANHHGPKSTQR
jgi:hypothetical protein